MKEPAVQVSYPRLNLGAGSSGKRNGSATEFKRTRNHFSPQSDYETYPMSLKVLRVLDYVLELVK